MSHPGRLQLGRLGQVSLCRSFGEAKFGKKEVYVETFAKNVKTRRQKKTLKSFGYFHSYIRVALHSKYNNCDNFQNSLKNFINEFAKETFAKNVRTRRQH